MTSKFEEILEKLIKFKSISTDNSYKDEIFGIVEFYKDIFEKNEFKVEIFKNYDNPIILASFEKVPKGKTALIYGHYDVQPAELSDGWKMDPFKLQKDKFSFFGRGVADNKGQTLIHIATVIDLIKSGDLKYNVKFMLEGNEETGSKRIEKFVEEKKEKLSADFIIISDGNIIGKNPILELGFRGGANVRAVVSTANTDAHSGLFGSVMPSASKELVLWLSKLFDENYKINLPSFYKDIEAINSQTQMEYKKLPNNLENLQNSLGIQKFILKDGEDFYIKTSLEAYVEISSLKSGYLGEGFKNIVPAKAEAKLNFRFVKNQDINLILKELNDFAVKNFPEYIKFEIQVAEIYPPIKVDQANEYTTLAKESLKKAFGEDVLGIYSGGGLPIVEIFGKYLKIPQILVPLANEDCNMHGINENFNLDILNKGLNFSKYFFQK